MTSEHSHQNQATSGELTPLSAATPAKKTQLQDRDRGLSSHRLAVSSSGLLMRFALELWCGKIRREYAPTLLGLGGDFDPNWNRLVMACCPLDCEPVVLGLTTDGIGCSCSPHYPTPCKRDYKGMSSRKWRAREGAKATPTLPDKIGGTPHPEFVESLMGFPIGWTDCDR